MRNCFVDKMATSGDDFSASGDKLDDSYSKNIYDRDNNANSDEDNDFEYLPGSKLSDSQVFLNKRGGQVNLTPLIVDFRRLLSSKSSVPIIPGVSKVQLVCMWF